MAAEVASRVTQLASVARRRVRRQFSGGPRAGRSNAAQIVADPRSWTAVSGVQSVVRSEPIVFGERRPGFDTTMLVPPLGVFSLRGGRVIGRHGWPVTADGHLLTETTWHGEQLTPRPTAVGYGYVRRLDGTCLSLASDFAGGNFAHFVLDGLGRVPIARRAGVGLEDVDHVYLPQPTSPSARAIMAGLGVPEAKCVWATTGSVTADTMIVTTFPGRRRNYVDWIVDDLRASVPPPQVEPFRRLYVPRHGTRRIVNEDELRPILDRHGFEVHEQSGADDRTTFAEARIVVGAHGAGLANTVFCRPGTTVLELVPSDHVVEYYFTLAAAGGLRYACMVTDSLGTRGAVSSGRSPFDVRADPALLDHALTSLTD